MRKVFDRVTQRLQAFVAQRDDLALIVRVPEAEGALLFKLFDTMEESATSEMYWVFGDAFKDAASYAATVVENFAARHALFRLVQEQEKLPIWPPLPPALQDASLAPAQRLRECMTFARSLLPAPEGFVIVWVMFPMQIADRVAYAALMREVLQHEFPFPWCHHMRIILRDDSADPVLASTLRKAPRIAWYEPDLSSQAFEKALEEEIDDKTLPLEQRLQAVLVSAGMDYSHRRYDQALSKYQLLLRYHMAKGNHPLSALILNSIGEIFLARGKPKEAGECWETALVPATEGDPAPLPILTNIVWNLASLRISEKKWPEAENYFNEAQKLATLQRNASFKVVALEHLGQAQYEQGKIPEALETWNAGLTVAEKLELRAERKGVGERLRKHYTRTRDQAKLRELDQRMTATPAVPVETSPR